tara:strand:+ start:190 stop:1515 length:1326 start_codon:yes stop_codon:yes gene_type:complete
MANLQATTFSGGLFEKTGTTTVSGTTVTVDLATGTFFVADFQTLTGDVLKIVVNNVPSAAGKATSFNLKVIQGSTARQFKWLTLGSFKWNKYYKPGTGWITHPTVPTTNNSEDVYSFTTYDNGATWYCSVVIQDCKSSKCYGSRGVTAGGKKIAAPSAVYTNTIDYIAIGTPGDATDFGNLVSIKRQVAGCSDASRGIIAGGHPAVNEIDYITIGTPADAADFGNLTISSNEAGGMSNGHRGVFGGFYNVRNTIDYITIATLDNASNFVGVLTVARHAVGALSGNGSRGVFVGGVTGSSASTPGVNTMDYIDISGSANAQDFGDMVIHAEDRAGTSDGVRGVIMGGMNLHGSPRKNEIDYITIATLSNAVDFGNLTLGRDCGAGISNGSRGIASGGSNVLYPNNAPLADTIDYITIATTGDATDFGNLTEARWQNCGFSGD